VIEPILKLLRGPLDTFEKVEVGVALYRAPGRALSTMELARVSGLEPEHVLRGIAELRQAKLANEVGELVRLTLRTSDEPAFHALVEQYTRDRSALAHAMSEAARDKIRSMAAHAFAEAFEAGRKKDGDG